MADTTGSTTPRQRPAPLGAVPDWLRIAADYSWRVLIIGLLTVIVASALARLYVVTLPIAVAAIVCTITIPPAKALQRRGLRPGAAAAVVVVGGLVAIGGFLAILAPSFLDQLRELGPTLTAAREDLFAFLADSPLNLSRDRLDELVSGVQSGGDGLLSNLVTGATLVAEALAGIVLMIVLVFFFTKDSAQIGAWTIDRIPEQRRNLARALASRAWTSLGGYVRGTALIALIDAVAIGVALAVIGVPLVLPIAVLVFLGAFLPVVGALLSGSVGVLVALADGGVGTAIAALIAVLAVQQVEGNLLQPTIMKRAVSLHPTVILIALTAGAATAGIAGAFLSVPFAAMLSAIGNEVRVRAQLPGEQGPDPVTGPRPEDEPPPNETLAEKAQRLRATARADRAARRAAETYPSGPPDEPV